ncbi:hypothetical protein DKT77_14140 [Meridianimarinicoccus roseus]|uniref:SGNH hydrolase-type esterase domain-containing protein n=1 Tax=Meridianimarinicoccus roseus TaxID=2072018 RepID=A0A2V2L926_9RHOB|nr:SGNH/GDSL hydrolase family protein [Meridianimarinicoccus roseus]PWR01948.1 hypothetical protein DKT77_14140 [Meridianimarinicoccus roseus]
MRRCARGLRLLPVAGLFVVLGGAFMWTLRAPPAAVDRPLPHLAAPAAADDPLRITVMGTSLTERYDWPAAAAARLQGCLGRPVALTVIARGGAASNWGAAPAQLSALQRSRPDILLLEFTVNDADLRRRVGTAAARDNHVAIIDAARAVEPDTRVVLTTLNRARGLRALLRVRIAAYEAQYDALARELDTGRLALGADWARALEAGDPDALIPDGVHPSPEAVARIVTPRVAAYLETLAACRP